MTLSQEEFKLSKTDNTSESWSRDGVPIDTIYIDNPNDSRIGYLSNASMYGFELEGKRWPSVEHYWHAKKFVGTHYEEEIRKAPTIYRVRCLVRERYYLYDDQGKVIKKKIYGTGSGISYHIRSDWDQIESSVLEEAIRAKFRQNPRLMKKLQETDGLTLIDTTNEHTGPILESLRAELTIKSQIQENTKGADLDTSLESSSGNIQDVKTPTLSEDEKNIIDGVLTIAFAIQKIEGQTQLHPEMIEDAILNLSTDKTTIKLLQIHVIHWLYNMPWTNIYRYMPCFEKLYRSTHLLLQKTAKTEIQMKTSALLTSLIRWMRLKSTKEQYRDILWHCVHTSSIKIILPPIKRWYRVHTPSKIPKITNTPKTIHTNNQYTLTTSEKSLQKGTSSEAPFGSTSLKSLSGSTPKRSLYKTDKGSIQIQNQKNVFLVSGDIQPYLPRLLVIGGRYVKKDRDSGKINKKILKFPYHLKHEVESLFTTPKESFQMNNNGISSRIIWDLFDVVCRYIKLCQPKDIKKFVESIILNQYISSTDPYDSNINITKLLESKSYSDLSPEIKKYLNTLSQQILPLSTNQNRSDSKKDIPNHIMKIIQQLRNLCQRGDSKEIVRSESYFWISLTIVPPKLRQQLSQYLKLVIKSEPHDLKSAGIIDISHDLPLEVNIDEKDRLIILATLQFLINAFKNHRELLLNRFRIFE
jgi:predicted NAD-dependent protein-ADP-ribosyltransferase YbiA (DUF1768 family)